MREVDLRHATAAEHRAQLVPAAEATRLFHSYSSPLPSFPAAPCVGGRRSAARAYGTRHALRDPASADS
ncbi:hypothetical protein EEJ42_37975 [Streptomyces botrytidirepellens]|uniref:Uncharacterized protein n=1 Tax=Streptomyces botrytidirepellens TaxID=2486417 RepID=A0A3M8TP69_9ACTN|nr:hypothetical protein EEJ42_37975 [Streptomyces botrytidirepellens]